MNHKKGELYLIPTLLSKDAHDASVVPILKNAVKETHIFLVENIRSARRFISSLKLGLTIEDLIFYELSKRTSTDEVIQLMKSLDQGQNLAIISEAGLPCLADPGAKAVSIAQKKGIKINPITGPSSIFLALIASGFNGQRFCFHGYLSIDKELRKKEIKSLEKKANSSGETQIFMETPYRNDSLLSDLLKSLGDSSFLCIATNITADDEIIKTKSVREWKSDKPNIGKNPTMFLIGNLQA